MYLVWSSQLGAEEKHVAEAAQLMDDARATHYWDGQQRVGQAYQSFLGISQTAWDYWMIFGPDAAWPESEVPEPDWWEHQLRELPKERRLDAKRFAAKATELLPRVQAASAEK